MRYFWGHKNIIVVYYLGKNVFFALYLHYFHLNNKFYIYNIHYVAWEDEQTTKDCFISNGNMPNNTQTLYWYIPEDGHTPKENIVDCWGFPDPVLIYDYVKWYIGALIVIITQFTHKYKLVVI